jgi:hypothetical protein
MDAGLARCNDEMVRTLFAVAISAVAVSAGVTSSALARTGSAPTRIVVYSPFTLDSELAQGIRVSRSASGSCWEGSVESIRPDAWRCTVGNNIYDPCYSGPHGWVACPLTTFGSRVLRITLTRSLPPNTNPPLNTNKADPLQIVLRGGVHCGFAGGATGTVAGMRLNYTCSNGMWLIGDPDRRKAVWSILALASLKASHADAVTIASASF